MAKKTANEVADLCREYGAQVLETLVEIMMQSESDQARLRAAQLIWDRAYGNQKGGEESGEQLSSLPTDERIRVLTAALEAEKDKLADEIRRDLSIQ